MLDLTPAALAAALVAVIAGTAVTSGIATFAIGIVVGLVSVLLTDRIVRRRLHTDYEAWIAAGCPERRRTTRRR
jgi:hypothetical protein